MSDIQIALTTGILVIAFIGLVIDIIEKTTKK